MKLNIYYILYPETHNSGYLTAIDKLQIPLIHQYDDRLSFPGAFMFCPDRLRQVPWEDEPKIVVKGGDPEMYDKYEKFFVHLLDEYPSYPLEEHELYKQFYIHAATPLKEPEDGEYDLSISEHMNRVIYSVKRPDTPEPFTLIAPEPMALFVYLYRDKDWGLFRNDERFLQYVWDKFKEEGKVEGELTTERLEEQEYAYRTSYVPIEVYRQSISKVKDMIDRELEGTSWEPTKKIK